MHSVRHATSKKRPLFAQGLLNFPAELYHGCLLRISQPASQPVEKQISFSDFHCVELWRSLKGLAERPFEISFLALVVVECLWGLLVVSCYSSLLFGFREAEYVSRAGLRVGVCS